MRPLIDKKSACTAGAFLMMSLLWAYVAGKDLNWDFINYHFYGAAALVDARLSQDYFAASIQSYLNPIAYVPHFLMVKAGWHSLWVSAILTLAQTANLLFIWIITKRIIPEKFKGDQIFSLLVISTALAFFSPLHLAELGGSFADITSATPMLAAVYLMMGVPGRSSFRNLLLIGFLFGIASGTKLTNGVFLVIAFFVSCGFIWQAEGLRIAFKSAITLSIGALIGIVLTHGYWSYLLWEQFGNPFFPLFNVYLSSPDFLGASFQDRRFLGSGWLGLITLPFSMTLHQSWIYTENVSVDMRVLALFIVGGCAVALCLHRVVARKNGSDELPSFGLALSALVIFWILSYILWGATFRIGRYAYVLWMLVGPLMVGLLVTFWSLRTTRVVLGLVLALQVFALWSSGSPRFTPTQWEKKWIDVSVPSDLKDRPYTLLTMGTQSYAVIAPFLHPDSSVINIVGQYNQPGGKNMTAKLTAHLSVPTDRIRIVFRDRSSALVFTQPNPKTREDVNAIVSVYGLKLGGSACQPIEINYDFVEGTLLDTQPPKVEGSRKGDRLVACPALKLNEVEQASVLRQLAAVDKIFDDVEKVCGDKISPHGVQTLRGRNGWLRNYFNTLTNVAMTEDTIYIRPFRSMVDFSVGDLASWKLGEPGFKGICPELPKTMGFN